VSVREGDKSTEHLELARGRATIGAPTVCGGFYDSRWSFRVCFAMFQRSQVGKLGGRFGLTRRSSDLTGKHELGQAKSGSINLCHGESRRCSSSREKGQKPVAVGFRLAASWFGWGLVIDVINNAGDKLTAKEWLAFPRTGQLMDRK
jgi:hypothetical protein